MNYQQDHIELEQKIDERLNKMTTREFNSIVEKVNNNTFFNDKGSIVWLVPMRIYLLECICPIQGEYFVGIKDTRTFYDLREGIINTGTVEKIKIHYKYVQRIDDNLYHKRNIEYWKYTEPTIKDIRKKKLLAIKRLSKIVGESK